MITYLRLTCFDQLGQPENWTTFDTWIESKKKKIERENIIALIKSTDQIDFTKELFNEYQKIYGVKNSFYKFLNEIIPNKARDELLSKIKIEYHDSSMGLIEESNSINEKIGYLYKIRNEYTHKGISNEPIHDFKSKSKTDDWNIREYKYKGTKSSWIYSSNDFHEQLKITVFIGISERIKKY